MEKLFCSNIRFIVLLFILIVIAVTDTRARGKCNCGRRLLTEPTGVITSPNYPNRYPNNCNCLYTIRTTSSQRIVIQFNDIDFVGRCSNEDYLEIYNGARVLTKLVAKLCYQQEEPSLIISEGDTLLLYLVTNRRMQGNGFSALYMTIPTATPIPLSTLQRITTIRPATTTSLTSTISTEVTSYVPTATPIPLQRITTIRPTTTTSRTSAISTEVTSYGQRTTTVTPPMLTETRELLPEEMKRESTLSTSRQVESTVEDKVTLSTYGNSSNSTESTPNAESRTSAPDYLWIVIILVTISLILVIICIAGICYKKRKQHAPHSVDNVRNNDITVRDNTNSVIVVQNKTYQSTDDFIPGVVFQQIDDITNFSSTGTSLNQSPDKITSNVPVYDDLAMTESQTVDNKSVTSYQNLDLEQHYSASADMDPNAPVYQTTGDIEQSTSMYSCVEGTPGKHVYQSTDEDEPETPDYQYANTNVSPTTPVYQYVDPVELHITTEASSLQSTTGDVTENIRPLTRSNAKKTKKVTGEIKKVNNVVTYEELSTEKPELNNPDSQYNGHNTMEKHTYQGITPLINDGGLEEDSFDNREYSKPYNVKYKGHAYQESNPNGSGIDGSESQYEGYNVIKEGATGYESLLHEKSNDNAPYTELTCEYELVKSGSRAPVTRRDIPSNVNGNLRKDETYELVNPNNTAGNESQESPYTSYKHVEKNDVYEPLKYNVPSANKDE